MPLGPVLHQGKTVAAVSGAFRTKLGGIQGFIFQDWGVAWQINMCELDDSPVPSG